MTEFPTTKPSGSYKIKLCPDVFIKNVFGLIQKYSMSDYTKLKLCEALSDKTYTFVKLKDYIVTRGGYLVSDDIVANEKANSILDVKQFVMENEAHSMRMNYLTEARQEGYECGPLDELEDFAPINILVPVISASF